MISWNFINFWLKTLVLSEQDVLSFQEKDE